MSTANRPAGQWSARTVGVVLVLGVVCVAVGAAGAAAASPPATGGPGAVVQAENNTTNATNATNVTVPIVDALGAAENGTNGTAVGARLTRKGSITDLERPTRVYEVDVLADNGTHFLVDVNATNGSVRAVTAAENETGFLDRLFGEDSEVPEEEVDLDAIRSASEAVELARNETGTNRTVTEVALESRNDTLVYAVVTVTGEGARATIVVAANPEDGDVLTTEGEGADEESEHLPLARAATASA